MSIDEILKVFTRYIENKTYRSNVRTCDLETVIAKLRSQEARVWELEGLAVDQANILKLRDAKLQAAEELNNAARLVDYMSEDKEKLCIVVLRKAATAYRAAGKGDTK